MPKKLKVEVVSPTIPLLAWFAIVPLAIWSSLWTALALWFSARNGEKAWFIFFILVHLAGIPEMIYLRTRKFWPFKP